MDKRTLLTSKVFTMDDGYSLKVNVFLKKGKRGILARIEYGELCLYTNRVLSDEKLLSFVKKVYHLRKKQITQRPFRKENIYIYRLGKKCYFTNDIKKKGVEGYYYIPGNTKDPLTRYKKDFLSYLEPRVREIGKRRGVDLSSWTIRTGLFQSYYGCCAPKKKWVKFDYRLFAYKPEISDSVIIPPIFQTLFISKSTNPFSV